VWLVNLPSSSASSLSTSSRSVEKPPPSAALKQTEPLPVGRKPAAVSRVIAADGSENS
jgi:hypothetical protein